MRFRLLGSAAILVASIACGGGATDASPTPVIALDGSSTVFPISQAVAEEFGAAQPGKPITVGFSGTSGGMKKFCRNEIAIANASRPISTSEVEACAAANIGYIELPVAYDGLAVVVHPSNTWAASMTVAELRKMWAPEAQGTITRWNQIRPSWPDQEIRLFGAGIDSGTFDYFTEAIMGKAKMSRGDYTSSENDNILVQGVSGDQYALGFMGLAYYEENRGKLKLVAIDDEDPSNGAGPIEPSFDTVRNGTYRPLSRPLLIYVTMASLERPEVRDFLGFYLDNTSKLAQEVGYVSLTDRELSLVKDRFTSRKTGSMFLDHAAQSTRTLEQLLGGQQ